MMFKVFFLAVVCFIVADARRLNRFFWDDDSIVEHFNYDLDQTKRDNRLCLPEYSGNVYTAFTPKDTPRKRIWLKENLKEVKKCNLNYNYEDRSKIECKPIEHAYRGGKVTIGCKAVQKGK